MDLISELKWRGLYKDTTDLEKLKTAIKNNDAFYLGIDPTSDSIHIGHLLSINLLRILSSHNMKPFLLIGGATASIGDPSGKTSERSIIRSKELVHNINSLTNQIEDIYKLNNKTFGNKFTILNNLEWYQDMDLIKFLRDYGKHINIASMISKDNVKKRIETGISFTEFSYQLLQGFDWVHLREKYGVKLQIGGSDQWGNIVTGTELVRKSLKKEDVAGMTVNLLLDKSGNKIGKTSSGEVIWLSEKKTSSFKLHQYLRSQNDDMAMDLVKKLTLISKESFDNLLEIHKGDPKSRIFQNYISKYLISFLGHKTSYEVVIKVSNAIFSGNYNNLNLKELDLIYKETESIEVPLNKEAKLIDFLEENNLINSRRELREQIKNRAFKINNNIIENEDIVISKESLLHNKYLVVRFSKKNVVICKVK